MTCNIFHFFNVSFKKSNRPISNEIIDLIFKYLLFSYFSALKLPNCAYEIIFPKFPENFLGNFENFRKISGKISGKFPEIFRKFSSLLSMCHHIWEAKLCGIR